MPCTSPMYCVEGVRNPICQLATPSGADFASTSSARLADQPFGSRGTTSFVVTDCCASFATEAQSTGFGGPDWSGLTTTTTMTKTTSSDAASAMTRFNTV